MNNLIIISKITKNKCLLKFNKFKNLALIKNSKKKYYISNFKYLFSALSLYIKKLKKK